MTTQRDEINDIIEKKTLNEGPQKVQLSAKLSLHKEARDNGEASDIDIYAISKMTPVHHRLFNKTFFTWWKRCSLSSSCWHRMEVVGFFKNFCGLI